MHLCKDQDRQQHADQTDNGSQGQSPSADPTNAALFAQLLWRFTINNSTPSNIQLKLPPPRSELLLSPLEEGDEDAGAAGGGGDAGGSGGSEDVGGGGLTDPSGFML